MVVNLHEMECLYDVCTGQLNNFLGRKVAVIGLVTKVHPNGVSFEMTSTDNILLKVNCRQPVPGPLEGYIQVIGIPQQSNTIICEEIIQFPSDPNDEFDVQTYNSYVKLLHAIPNLYNTTRK